MVVFVTSFVYLGNFVTHRHHTTHVKSSLLCHRDCAVCPYRKYQQQCVKKIPPTHPLAFYFKTTITNAVTTFYIIFILCRHQKPPGAKLFNLLFTNFDKQIPKKKNTEYPIMCVLFVFAS